ncbi:hypothetical protein [Chryseobacterium sp. GP-SGM7]|uniref:hypothetical protein n=1 Tax=Chryseobacterium sp. GP-SGM7 TaxID=3411323 RepID=UPI003B92D734
MNYSTETKPAKILNFRSLKEINESLLITRSSDAEYFSIKKPENNNDRVSFSLTTSDINIQPVIRQVVCTNKGKRYNNYKSFVIEPKSKSTGIVVIMIKLEEQETFFCNLRILPLNKLSDIADTEVDSKLLTLNLEKSKYILKTDITVTSSNTGEPLYSVHDVDVNATSDLVTQNEIIELKRELEFQGAKLIAHYFQEIVDIILKENSNTTGKTPLIPDEYYLSLPNNQLKEIISANAIAGCIALEIVGANVIKDLNRDWTSAAAYIEYLF